MTAWGVPESVAAQLPKADVPPGHNFLLYWAACSGEGGASPAERKAAVDAVCRNSTIASALSEQLAERQSRLAAGRGAWTALTRLVAPLATGLGNEHPLENGFAFLSPYGLPYLPGSSVKGVLRQAAEQLVMEAVEVDGHPLDWVDVWWLFGFEGGTADLWDEDRRYSDDRRHLEATLHALALRPELDALAQAVLPPHERHLTAADFLRELCVRDRYREFNFRGVLDFWDAFPVVSKGPLLTTEIMTPHHGPYYQGEGRVSPHDAGQPVPVTFIAVPPKARLAFHIAPSEHRMPAGLRARWRPALECIFAHACDWVGFGAKTALGYGALVRDIDAENAMRLVREAADAAARLARMSPEEQAAQAELVRIQSWREVFTQMKPRQFDPSRDESQRRDWVNQARELVSDAARADSVGFLREVCDWMSVHKGKDKKARDRIKDFESAIAALERKD